MIKGRFRDFRNEWPSLWLASLLLFAFAVGGASREGLNAHIYLFAFGWIGAGLLIALRYDDLIQSVPKVPFILLALLIVWCLFTVIPLPAQWVGNNNILYSNVLSEREALGHNTDWLTLSLTPRQTLRSLLAFGPGVFVILCVSLMGDKQRQNLLYGILLFGIISIFLGLAQISLGGDSRLYFWETTNRGSGVGIFANANHQTIFAALLIPIVLGQAARYRRKFREGDKGLALALLFVALLLIVVIGVMIGGATAGYGLAVLAFILSITFLRSSKKDASKREGFTLIISLIFIISFIAFINTSPQLGGLDLSSFDGGELSRREIFIRSLNPLRQNYLTGTGFGSFVEIYPFFEDPKNVSRTFVNHAHNDWLEWIVELGLVGISLLAIFIVWLANSYAQVFLVKEHFTGRRLSIASSISVFVLILHSLVDYPLRTPFLSSIFCALLLLSITKPFKKKEVSSNGKLSEKRSMSL